MSGRCCRCARALARDNHDRLCAVCQATRRRDRAPDVPDQFWETEALADALASGDVGRVLRAYRCHPFHGERLPQTLVAGWLHMSQPAVCRIETGRRRMTIDEIAHIAAVLGMPPLAVPWMSQRYGEDVDLSRRSLLGVGAGAALGLGATTAPTAASEIDPELVPHWMELLNVLDRYGAMYGPAAVLPLVQRELGLIAQHRRLARNDLRTNLLRTEARWAELAAWLSNDTGYLHHRDVWADHSLGLAREAGYRDMEALVLLRRSAWGVERLDAGDALTFADAARAIPGTNGEIRALCALKRAHAHALHGEADATERSLADTRSLLATGGAEAPWGDLVTQEITPLDVLADDARCWLWLSPSRAHATFDEVLGVWPVDRARDRGVLQARLALACATDDQPERAAAEGIKVLDIDHAIKSDVTLRELRRLDRRLAGCDLRAVTDFREAFAAL